MALAYYVVTPASYVSNWSMILPGSGSSVSLSLESIGQSSSAPSQWVVAMVGAVVMARREEQPGGKG